MARFFIALFAFILPLSAFAAPSASEGGGVPVMFVQSAKNVSFEGNKMTLKGIGPSTIFFSDRPERMAGHLTLQQFLKEWDQGKDSFKNDPPNATLSTFEEKQVNYVVVEINNPQLKGEDLSYDVRILEGTPPTKGGLSSLFIDWVAVRFGGGPYYGPGPFVPYGPYGPGPYCRRNWYNGMVYCHRPGWYPY